jgi:hypothetical protein
MILNGVQSVSLIDSRSVENTSSVREEGSVVSSVIFMKHEMFPKLCVVSLIQQFSVFCSARSVHVQDISEVHASWGKFHQKLCKKYLCQQCFVKEQHAE